MLRFGMKQKVTYMVHEHESHDPGIYVPTPAIIPEIPGNKGGYCEAYQQKEWDEVLVLPAHDCALREVADVGEDPTARLEHNPADMRVKESLVRVVRIEVGVGETVMRAVAPTPPFD